MITSFRMMVANVRMGRGLAHKASYARCVSELGWTGSTGICVSSVSRCVSWCDRHCNTRTYVIGQWSFHRFKAFQMGGLREHCSNWMWFPHFRAHWNWDFDLMNKDDGYTYMYKFRWQWVDVYVCVCVEMDLS